MTEIPALPIEEVPDREPAETPRRRGRPRGSRTRLRMQPNFMELPFPLRDGVTVLIRNLPGDLTPREAERLVVFIRTLAIPEGLAPASPEQESAP